ncbi:TPA: MFS transporter [Morganella morganii]
MRTNTALLSLSVGAFAIGATEFSPMGMLPEIAGSLAVSIPAAGMLVVVYALGVMLGAPVMTLLLIRRSPKAALIFLMSICNRPFVTGTGAVLCVYATSSAFPLILSLLLQNGMGATPLEAGLIFVPSSIGFVIASFITPRMIIGRGEPVIYYGALGYAASYLVLIAGLNFLPQSTANTILSLFLFLVGFTQGMIMTPMLNIVLSRVTPAQAGMASGLTATLQQIGAATGATAVSVILQFSLRHSGDTVLLSTPAAVYSVSLGFNVLMALCAAYLIYRITRARQPEIVSCL